MFDKNKVADSLFGLVGFKTPADPQYIVSSENQESRSGRFATDSPYCKISQLAAVQDYYLADNTQFNEYLTGLQKRSISDVVDRVINEPSYIDRQVLYQFANNKVKTETLPDGFVGYKIRKSLEKNVAFEITRIFLEFQGTGDFELLLFNSSQKEPVESKTISVTGAQQVEQLNWRVDNTGDYFQGDWYLGYLTDGLTITPFEREYERSKMISTITHLHFQPMYFVGATRELFDLEDTDNAFECWGLNPDITVFNDYTDLIIENEMLFASAIQQQMVINSVQEVIASARSNREQQIAEENLSFLIAQLEGVEGSITGMIPTLQKELTMLSKQIKRLADGYFASGFQLNTLS